MLLVGDPEELSEEGVQEKVAAVAEHAAADSGVMDGVSADMPTQSVDSTWEEADVAPPVLPEDGINLKEAVDKYETALIMAALERSNWVKNKAAALLQLNRTTLVEKLKKKKLLNKINEEAAA